MIRAILKRPEWTQAKLAAHFGVTQPTVHRWLKGAEPEGRHWQEIRNLYEGDRDRERMAPILGLAGAGPDGSVLFAEGQGNFGEVPAPPDSGENITALEVRGDSMHGLANDGWLIFYEDRTEPRDEYMGEPCVCWLENGHVLVKVPEPTLVPGLFNLTSTNASTMRSVAVREMALVTDIRPRRAAQRFIRRNPEREVMDVHNGPRSEGRK